MYFNTFRCSILRETLARLPKQENELVGKKDRAARRAYVRYCTNFSHFILKGLVLKPSRDVLYLGWKNQRDENPPRVGGDGGATGGEGRQKGEVLVGGSLGREGENREDVGARKFGGNYINKI